jgi:hypothetical protein
MDERSKEEKLSDRILLMRRPTGCDCCDVARAGVEQRRASRAEVQCAAPVARICSSYPPRR